MVSHFMLEFAFRPAPMVRISGPEAITFTDVFERSTAPAIQARVSVPYNTLAVGATHRNCGVLENTTVPAAPALPFWPPLAVIRFGLNPVFVK